MQCLVCKTDTTSQLVIYSQIYNGQLVAVENVPAELCPNVVNSIFQVKRLIKFKR